jgi:hypothetical protein
MEHSNGSLNAKVTPVADIAVPSVSSGEGLAPISEGPGLSSDQSSDTMSGLHGRGSAVGVQSRRVKGAPPPNSCIVLKNLDYNISPLELENIVREVLGGRKTFHNLSLVEDKNTGSFRGMAFINFHAVEEATAALPALAALKVNNRKVVAEYRRLRPGEKDRREALEKRQKKTDASNNRRATFEMDIPVEVDELGNQVDKRVSFFAKRDTIKKADDRFRSSEKIDREKEMEADFRTQLVAYRETEVQEGEEIQDVCFDQDLSSFERRIVHVLCDELDLGHVSRSTSEGSRVLFVTKDPGRKAKWEIETADARAGAAKKAAEKAALAEEKRKKQRDVQGATVAESAGERGGLDEVGGSGSGILAGGSAGQPHASGDGGHLAKEQMEGIKWFRPRSAMQVDGGDAVEGGSGTMARGIEKPSYKLYIPPRQPTGPDGTIGFQRRNPNPVGSESNRDTATSMSLQDNGTHAEDTLLNVADASRNVSVTGPTSDGILHDIAPANTSTSLERKPRTILNPSVPEFKFPVV